YMAEAVRAGACGYVAKDADAGQLLAAVRAAAVGQRYLSPPLPEAALAAGGPADPYDTLTPREREVLQLTAEGSTGAQIAGKLHISVRTVESHRANVLRKLGLKNQKEMVRYALQRRPGKNP